MSCILPSNSKFGESCMSENPEISAAPNISTCSNCHSTMPAELRFCRNCGFRLGEGVADYTETVRFNQNQAIGSRARMDFAKPKRRGRMSGMAWIFVALLVFFVGAAGFTAIITPHRQARLIQM